MNKNQMLEGATSFRQSLPEGFPKGNAVVTAWWEQCWLRVHNTCVFRCKLVDPVSMLAGEGSGNPHKAVWQQASADYRG